MKTGLILYITGEQTDYDQENVIQTGKNRFAADRVEIVSRNAGYYDINYAWWTLTAAGMHRVICMLVQINDHGVATFNENCLRLCG